MNPSRAWIACLCSALLLIACQQAGPLTHQHQQNTVAFDFAPYTERGFLITPQSYDGSYQSIGQITLTIWPRAVETKIESIAERVAGRHDSTAQSGTWVVEQITTEELVESTYNEARRMGADAIVNFNVSTQTRHLSGRYSGQDLRLTGYNVSGFAIDRGGE